MGTDSLVFVLIVSPVLAMIVFLLMVFVCMKLGIIKINGEMPKFFRPFEFKWFKKLLREWRNR